LDVSFIVMFFYASFLLLNFAGAVEAVKALIAKN
jgi:hypothetical protein